MILGILVATLVLLGALAFWFWPTEPEVSPPEEEEEEIPQVKKAKKKKSKQAGLNFSRLKKSKKNRTNKQKDKKGGNIINHKLLLNPLQPHNFEVHNCAFSHDGKSLATCSEDGDVRVWKLSAKKEECKYSRFQIAHGLARDYGTAIAFGPNDKYVAVGLNGHNRRIQFYKNPLLKSDKKKQGSNKKKFEENKNEPLKEFPSHHKDQICTLLIAPDNVYLLTCCKGQDVTIKLWEPRDGSLIHTIKKNQLMNYNAAMSACGRFITVATMMAEVNVWEVFGLKEKTVDRVKRVMPLKGHKASVHCARFSGPGLDGEIHVATASKDGTWKWWDIGVRNRSSLHNDPKMLREYKVGEPVDRIEVSPSRDFPVVAVNIGAEIRFYNYKTGKQLKDTIPRAHNGEIKQMWFNPKGTVLVTAGGDKNVRLWRVPSPK